MEDMLLSHNSNELVDIFGSFVAFNISKNRGTPVMTVLTANPD